MARSDQDATWYKGSPRPGQRIRCRPSSTPAKGTAPPPIFGPCLLWPNGWMDQDATWYEGRPRPRPHCYMGIQLPPKRGDTPIFGPCLLWPHGHPSQLLLSTCYVLHYVLMSRYFIIKCHDMLVDVDCLAVYEQKFKMYLV